MFTGCLGVGGASLEGLKLIDLTFNHQRTINLQSVAAGVLGPTITGCTFHGALIDVSEGLTIQDSAFYSDLPSSRTGQFENASFHVRDGASSRLSSLGHGNTILNGLKVLANSGAIDFDISVNIDGETLIFWGQCRLERAK